MIGKILGFFTGGSVMVYVWLSMIALIGSLSFGVYYYHGKYQTEVTSYEVVKSKNDELVLQIQVDSAAVDKLAADSTAREATAKLALAASQITNSDFVKKSQQILLVQPTSTDTCKSSNDLFNLYIGAK